MFFVSKIFWGVPPKILDMHSKTEPSTNHRAKFHASRPTHLGDLVLNIKFAAKHKQPRNLGQSSTRVCLAPLVRLGKKGVKSRIKVTWSELKCIGIRRTRIVDLG